MKKVKAFPRIDGNIGWYDISPHKGKIKGGPLTGNHIVNFTIIGAGFTGVATARRLAELHPNAKIALVDALKIGQGASGRNSGMLIDIPISRIENPKEFDCQRESTSHSLNKFAINRMKGTLDEHNIDAHWTQSGRYLAAREADNYHRIENFIAVLKQLGEPHEVLSQSQLTKNLGTEFYNKAVYTPNSILVNPASLIMGLASVLPKNIRVYENSPLRSMSLEGEKGLWFDKGKIKTDKIIFATNAFNEATHVSKNRLAPMFTYASLTRVLTSKELKGFNGVMDCGYGVSSAHAAGTSLRFTCDNRILIRNTVRASLKGNQAFYDKALKRHRSAFINRFPQLKQVPFEYTWGGNICMTLNHNNEFHESHPGVYSVAGMNATGIVKGTYLGYYMAEYINGNNSPELDYILDHSQPSWVPPEPLRTIGAAASLYSIERKAGIEM